MARASVAVGLAGHLTSCVGASWKPGQTQRLAARLLAGGDAAHKGFQDMLDKGEKLPIDFTYRLVYYVGPVDPVRDEVVGPAGPTTSTRMDKFTEMMPKKTGLSGAVGKADPGPVAVGEGRKPKAAHAGAGGRAGAARPKRGEAGTGFACVEFPCLRRRGIVVGDAGPDS